MRPGLAVTLQSSLRGDSLPAAGHGISSPYARRGLLWRKVNELYGNANMGSPTSLPTPKDTLYLNFLPLLNSGKVRLLDNKRLVTQLIGLERNTSREAIRLSAFECLLMAQSGRAQFAGKCPLSDKADMDQTPLNQTPFMSTRPSCAIHSRRSQNV